jgi:putative glutamine amidotransferase
VKPIIGISCSWNEEKGHYFLGGMYAGAVEAGGGLPIPLVYSRSDDDLKRICSAVNGLILSGGGDVDPVYFGEDPIPAGGDICPDRDQFEIRLARQAMAANIPILGICRGMQVLNIAAGGDIYQDIDSQLGQMIKHFQQAPRWHPTHEIMVEEGTLLASIWGTGVMRVNSFHHQAVRNPAPGFVISARSPDGLAEAIESADLRFLLGIQCHPETLWNRQPVFLTLFEKLVLAAKMRFAIN